MDEYALRMENITQVFGKVRVLDNITFRIKKGTVHGLVGQNGAGKSTLVKIAKGVLKPTAGNVFIGDKQMSFAHQDEARLAGLGMVFQELSLVPTLSIVDNIFLNDEKKIGPLINNKSQKAEAAQLFERLGVDMVPLQTKVESLSIAERQLVEIVKALRLANSVLILDEPTAALAQQEVEQLFRVVQQVTKLGIGVVFITHYLEDIIQICDEVTVLRDGVVTLCCDVKDTSVDDMVERMIELDTVSTSAEKPAEIARTRSNEKLLEIKGLSVKGELESITFDLFKGEIVGVAGLAGSGQTELLKAIYGAIPYQDGNVILNGNLVHFKDPGAAIRAGVYLIPKDRRHEGLVLDHSVEDNVVLSILKKLQRFFFYSAKESERLAQDYSEDFAIKVSSIHQSIRFLSGGNQQKVVLAKAFSTGSKLLLLDEPTFGVDVKTTEEIKERVRRLAQDGGAALWVSSELRELIDVCDRIIILADGKLNQIVSNESGSMTEEQLGRLIQW